jgi:hypothetical protein
MKKENYTGEMILVYGKLCIVGRLDKGFVSGPKYWVQGPDGFTASIKESTVAKKVKERKI